MSALPLYGGNDSAATERDGLRHGSRHARELPMRQLNARMFGHGRTDDSDPADPVSLGGCGRIAEGGSWVPVYDTGDRWSPGSLATCNSALLCDFCGPRRQAESAARFGWHFDDYLAGAGQLVSLRVSIGCSAADDMATTLDLLNGAFNRLNKTAAWKRARIVDHSAVLHVRYHPGRNVFYPHLHLVAFIGVGGPVDIDEMTDDLRGAWVGAVDRQLKARTAEVERVECWDAATELQAAWRDRIARGIGRRVSRQHGLFARVITSSWQALYAWHWADPDERDTERADIRRDDLGRDYEPRHLAGEVDDHGGSWPLYRLAEAALDGDQQAWAAWRELARALKGVHVVRSSKVLDKVWKAHQDEQPTETPAPDLGEPRVQVHAGLWEKARRAGATEMALELGRTHGVVAMADWWAERLGVTVLVSHDDCPRLWEKTRDGPAVLPSSSLN